jgi:putative transposase
VSTRVSSAHAVIATGRKPTIVAKVAGISRQALYRPIARRPAGAGPGRGKPGDQAIVEVAKAIRLMAPAWSQRSRHASWASR